jgi:hypothetical protein
MIFKGSSDLSPRVNMVIDGVAVDYLSVKRLSMELHENMHNVVILEFAGLNPQLITEYIDRPVKVSIEIRERDLLEFCGYITHLEPFSLSYSGTVNKSPFQMTRVYCMGASYLMKSKKSRVWENKTISEIAQQISNTYKFSVSVPNDSYRFPRLVQSSESDWAFLVDTAQKLGYSVLVENTHINIWDPYKAINQRRSYSALYTIRGLYGSPNPQPGLIIEFDGRIGAVTPYASKTPDTIHVLDKQSSVLSVSNADSTDHSGLGTPVTTKFTNTYSVNADSFEMGKKLVDGELRRSFPFYAKVTVVGDPGITPGGIVNIKEYNAQFDGFWYVKSVNHEITQSSMVTHLEIVKDSTGSSEDIPMSTTAYIAPPAPALQGGEWISSADMVNVYV